MIMKTNEISDMVEQWSESSPNRAAFCIFSEKTENDTVECTVTVQGTGNQLASSIVQSCIQEPTLELILRAAMRRLNEPQNNMTLNNSEETNVIK